MIDVVTKLCRRVKASCERGGWPQPAGVRPAHGAAGRWKVAAADASAATARFQAGGSSVALVGLAAEMHRRVADAMNAAAHWTAHHVTEWSAHLLASSISESSATAANTCNQLSASATHASPAPPGTHAHAVASDAV